MPGTMQLPCTSKDNSPRDFLTPDMRQKIGKEFPFLTVKHKWNVREIQSGK